VEFDEQTLIAGAIRRVCRAEGIRVYSLKGEMMIRDGNLVAEVRTQVAKCFLELSTEWTLEVRELNYCDRSVARPDEPGRGGEWFSPLHLRDCYMRPKELPTHDDGGHSQSRQDKD
jgi:hypothetical protein